MLSKLTRAIGISGTDRSRCVWTLNGNGEKVLDGFAGGGQRSLCRQSSGAREQTNDGTGWTLQSDSNRCATETVVAARVPMHRGR